MICHEGYRSDEEYFQKRQLELNKAFFTYQITLNEWREKTAALRRKFKFHPWRE